MSTSQTVPPPISAVAYVRTATENQDSASNQMDTIRKYADRRGIQIVKEYSDAGKSGLGAQGLESLAELIRSVQNRPINFSAILLHDVSRWGRFQNADESAYYEFICRRAGVSVHYCADQFESEAIHVSMIVRFLKFFRRK
jgi:DNA invertase Pin-like site-specific DNA recombinase